MTTTDQNEDWLDKAFEAWGHRLTDREFKDAVREHHQTAIDKAVAEAALNEARLWLTNIEWHNDIELLNWADKRIAALTTPKER